MEEKQFVINLRREFMKAPSYKKSKKAVTAVIEYISHHMKVPIKDIRVGKNLNLKIWQHGRKNPPAKIKVKSAVKDKLAYVELPEFPLYEEKVEVKAKKKEERPKEVLSMKPKEEIVKEERKEEDLKTLEKEEIKEMKKEHKPELKEVPGHELKQNEKIHEKTQKMSKVIPPSGKKGAKDPKP